MKLKALIFYGALLLCIAAAVSLFFTFGTSTPAPEGGMLNNTMVVARVNGTEIRAEAVNRNLGPVDQDLLSDPTELRARQKSIIGLLIDRQLIKEEAERRTIAVTAAEVDTELSRQTELHGEEQLKELLSQNMLTLDDFRSELRDRLLFEKLMKSVRDELKKKIVVTPEEIAAYYQENRELYNISQVAHIYLRIPSPGTETEELATMRKGQGIIRQLKNGADFAALARRYSEDPSTASKGGLLGPINSGLFSAAFLDAALQLKAGEITQVPVKVQDGIHIIKRIDDRYLPLEQVSDIIRDTLTFPRLDKACNEFMANLRRNANIQILLK